MEDSLMTVIGFFLAAILMFVVPLMAVSERNDDITQLAVQTTTSEFVEDVASTGVISQSDYDAYIQKLAATGNTYDIEMEVRKLDENFGKKTVAGSGDLIGENSYYSVFTSSIENDMEADGKYELSKGDIVTVSAKNTNLTIAQLLRNFFYKVSGNDNYQVAASYTSVVINNGK